MRTDLKPVPDDAQILECVRAYFEDTYYDFTRKWGKHRDLDEVLEAHFNMPAWAEKRTREMGE